MVFAKIKKINEYKNDTWLSLYIELKKQYVYSELSSYGRKVMPRCITESVS